MGSLVNCKVMLPCFKITIPVNVVDFFSILPLLQNTLFDVKGKRFKRTGFSDWLFLTVDI